MCVCFILIFSTSANKNIWTYYFITVFWIHFILMWIRIRIRGSTSGNRGSGSDLKSKKFQFFFHLTFWVKIHTLLKTMFFVVSLMSMRVNQWFLLKKYDILQFWLIFMWISRFFLCYPGPDPRFLKWIQIRPNDTDPTGSETPKI